jgi:hypothetical protein
LRAAFSAAFFDDAYRAAMEWLKAPEAVQC